MEDDLSKKENYKMYAIYDWGGFVNAKNGYKNLTSSDYLPKFTSMPNHAILIGNLRFNLNKT